MMKFQDAMKLSDILEIAITDLHKIAGNAAYDINMGRWHSGGKMATRDYQGDKCEVCLAGAVMANSFSIAYERSAEPYNFGEEKKKLYAVNDARRGFITDALRFLGVGIVTRYYVNKFPDRAITSYGVSPAGFYSDMWKLIIDLRIEGQ